MRTAGFVWILGLAGLAAAKPCQAAVIQLDEFDDGSFTANTQGVGLANGWRENQYGTVTASESGGGYVVSISKEHGSHSLTAYGEADEFAFWNATGVTVTWVIESVTIQTPHYYGNYYAYHWDLGVISGDESHTGWPYRGCGSDKGSLFIFIGKKDAGPSCRVMVDVYNKNVVAAEPGPGDPGMARPVDYTADLTFPLTVTATLTSAGWSVSVAGTQNSGNWTTDLSDAPDRDAAITTEFLNGGFLFMHGRNSGIIDNVSTFPANSGRMESVKVESSGGTPNQPPTVSITSPADGATFAAPASIPITASASDADGSVARVEFFEGATKLGEDTSPSYQYTWGDVPAGTYSLTAKATDDDGATQVSAAVTVTVTPGTVTLPLKLDSGPDVTAGWADESPHATGGVEYTFAAEPDTSQVANAAPASVYKTCRHMDHSYSIPVPDGSYTVRLHFYDEVSGRAMDYTIEGQKVLDDFSPPAGVATVSDFPVNVSDGNGLQIVAEKDGGNDAFECGIEVFVPAANQPPTASITSPADGATFTAPATFTVTATASDPDGSVANVEFFNDGTKIGEDTSSPYTFTFTDTTAGSYSLTARATDDDGATATSSVVNVTVEAPIQDEDEDGLPDWWEELHFGSVLLYGADDDPDLDGLVNSEEYARGCDPQDTDTDGDGMEDGDEVDVGYDPTNPDQDGNGNLDGQDDWDGDLITNAQEIASGTYPGPVPVASNGNVGLLSCASSSAPRDCAAAAVAVAMLAAALACAGRRAALRRAAVS